MAEAQWEAEEILNLDPSYSVARVEQALPIRDPEYLERFLSDLRRACLPE